VTAALEFERALERYGSGDPKDRCAALVTDAMHWMAFNGHQIDDVLGRARDQFRLEARGNELPEPAEPGPSPTDRYAFFLHHYGGDAPESCLTDLLVDARHWCRATGHDFERIASRAEQHFQAELGDARPSPASELPAGGAPRGQPSLSEIARGRNGAVERAAEKNREQDFGKDGCSM
jgi:hypothetical protein